MRNDFENGANRIGTGCIKWDFQEIDYGKSGLIPFSIADADYPIYSPILEAIISRVRKGVIGYTDIDDDYLDSIVNWCKSRHNWFVQKNWIIPTNGIVPSISYAIEVFTKSEAKIVVQPPVYDPFYTIIEATGRKIVKNDLIINQDGRYIMDYNDLEEKFKDGATMLILCSPHNPVCRVWEKSELEKLSELCYTYNILIISDEIHWDLMLDGNKHISMGVMERIINQLVVCTSASKTFNIAGLETSNIIIPNEELRNKYQKWLYSRYLFCPNALGLEATKAAYKTGNMWVDVQNEHLTNNAKIVVDFFRTNFPQVKIANPEGTYLLWLDMRDFGLTSEELVYKIVQAGAGLNNGLHYGEGYDGFLRMNIACPLDQLIQGLECIKIALQ